MYNTAINMIAFRTLFFPVKCLNEGMLLVCDTRNTQAGDIPDESRTTFVCYCFDCGHGVMTSLR